MTYCNRCDKRIEKGGISHWTVKLTKPLLDKRPGRTFVVGSILDVCEECAFEMEDEKIGEIVIDLDGIVG